MTSGLLDALVLWAESYELPSPAPEEEDASPVPPHHL